MLARPPCPRATALAWRSCRSRDRRALRHLPILLARRAQGHLRGLEGTRSPGAERWCATRSGPTPTSASCRCSARAQASASSRAASSRVMLAAGRRADKVVFSGVSKTRRMRQALQAGIRFASTSSRPRNSEHLDAVAERARRARAGVAARESRTSTQDPPLHLHRPQGQQVRRRLRGRPALYRRAAALPTYMHHRRRLPHRLAAARPRALAEAAQKLRGTDPKTSPPTASCWNTSTSAAAGHPAIATRPHHRSRNTSPAAGGLCGSRGRALLQASPLHGRQRRSAADPHPNTSSRAEEELRDRRCACHAATSPRPPALVYDGDFAAQGRPGRRQAPRRDQRLQATTPTRCRSWSTAPTQAWSGRSARRWRGSRRFPRGPALRADAPRWPLRATCSF